MIPVGGVSVGGGRSVNLGDGCGGGGGGVGRIPIKAASRRGTHARGKTRGDGRDGGLKYQSRLN